MQPRIHLTIMQPLGYVHSLGFLDQARYARYQFRRLGAEVTIGKNRLREDAVNIIFGAHLGFPSSLKQRYTCIFFNLEQLGEGGAKVSDDYMHLLKSSAVMDYDERNLAAYGCKPGDVPVVSFQYAPYLARQDVLPLEDRPIDLLFFGSMNERRQAFIQRIEACGWNVSMFDQPLYAEERDHFIRQSKAVFNCHFYETSRFEQARAFHTLSLGTPVISERTVRTQPPQAFENSVTWVSEETIDSFFANEFMLSTWVAKAHGQMDEFADHDPLQDWALANEYACALADMNSGFVSKVWRPSQLAIGLHGEDCYQPSWWNVNTCANVEPDSVLDFSAAMNFPIHTRTTGGGRITVEANSIEKIKLMTDRMDPSHMPQLLCNALTLLQTDGCLQLELPLLRQPEVTKQMSLEELVLRAPWMSLVVQPGRLVNGCKFEITALSWLDSRSQPCAEAHARGIRVELKKTEITLHEQSMSRIFKVDFGGIPQDEVFFPELSLLD